MSEPIPEGARSSPATLRNREPILAELRRLVPGGARVLEIASGAGQHAIFFAEALPHVRWQPTDPDAEARASIAAWRTSSGLANVAPPLALDAADPDAWPDTPADVIVCINMIHISPWAATEGLITGAGRRLPAGGRLILYGPYLEDEIPTAPSNLDFDASLRSRNPAWGLRRREEVVALAAHHGLSLTERIAMPANNLLLVFTRA